jgi:uncharacterized protein (TIGR02118 family)
MIRVTVTYPNTPGSHFDADYYVKVHMPMAAKLLGDAVKSATAEIGISGANPDESPASVAVAGFTCESVEAFMRVFIIVADQLGADIPNYTDIEPIIQISSLTEFPIPIT